MSNYNAPYNYEFINLYNSARNPSSIHTRNTSLFNYFVRYLLKKVISVLDFENAPETWAMNYFKYVLFGYGYIAIFDTKEYGVIPQQCMISDTRTIFYQPREAIITNPVFSQSKRLTIGKDCELLKLQPDYTSVMDIITTYADLMAICLETAGVNLINSKTSMIFFADDKAIAETFKKVFDKVNSGEPMVVADKKLQSVDGVKNWEVFTQNVGQNYITSNILDDMKTLEDQFNTKVGIPNANTQKRERLISSEVMANDVDTKALVNVWLDTLNDDIIKVNKRYNLNLKVKYRYDNYYQDEVNKEVVDG